MQNRHENIKKYVEDFYAEHKYPPTVREIQKALNIKSTNTVFNDIIAMDKAEQLVKDGTHILPVFTKEYIQRLYGEILTDEE